MIQLTHQVGGSPRDLKIARPEFTFGKNSNGQKKLAWNTPDKATYAREDVELSSVAISNSPQGTVTVSKERWWRFAIVEQILCRWLIFTKISSTRTGPSLPQSHMIRLTQRTDGSGEISSLVPISESLHVKVAPVPLAGEIASSNL